MRTEFRSRLAWVETRASIFMVCFPCVHLVFNLLASLQSMFEDTLHGDDMLHVHMAPGGDLLFVNQIIRVYAAECVSTQQKYGLRFGVSCHAACIYPNLTSQPPRTQYPFVFSLYLAGEQDPRPETRNWKSQTPNPKPQTSNPKWHMTQVCTTDTRARLHRLWRPVRFRSSSAKPSKTRGRSCLNPKP